MKIAIIGGRGNGTVIASTIEDCRRAGQDLQCVGFLNDNEKEINGYPVIGGIVNDDWRRLPNDVSFIYAMSNIKMAHERYNMLCSLNIPLDRFTNVFHPTSVVSDKASIGMGVVLMPLTVVSPNVTIGNHSQIYAQGFVGHDTTLDEMVFVANNASIGGRVLVGKGAHIGSNASIVERITLGDYSVVGLGAVVLKPVRQKEKVVGNPARSIGFVE